MFRSIKIAGFPLPLYLGILVILYICMQLGCLPGGIVGGLLILMVVGEGLNTLGKTIPVVNIPGRIRCLHPWRRDPDGGWLFSGVFP